MITLSPKFHLSFSICLEKGVETGGIAKFALLLNLCNYLNKQAKCQ